MGFIYFERNGKKIWDLKKDYFNKFDKIIVSDTASLSRIFIGHGEFKKKLIVWIVNRFDYPHGVTRLMEDEYFSFFKSLINNDQVEVIPCSSAEKFYAKLFDINIINKPIYPIGKKSKIRNLLNSQWGNNSYPDNIKDYYYLPIRHNEKVFKIKDQLDTLNIKSYHGKYNDPEDIGKFKAIIHFPYALTTFSFYENIQNGAYYLTPSINFIFNLIKTYGIGQNGYAIQNINLFNQIAYLTDHYNPTHNMFVSEFDNLNEIRNFDNIDYNSNIEERKIFLNYHTNLMIFRWKKILLK